MGTAAIPMITIGENVRPAFSRLEGKTLIGIRLGMKSVSAAQNSTSKILIWPIFFHRNE